MSNNTTFPLFHTLLTKSSEELIQILADHGHKIPKDDHYYAQSITKHVETASTFINIIGKNNLIQIKSYYYLIITSLREEDAELINEIKNGNHVKIKLNNPFGPAYIDLIPTSNQHYAAYYINGEQLTKQQFEKHISKKRIRAINE